MNKRAVVCSLLYVDLGANDGDTLLQFVGHRDKDTSDFTWMRRLLDTAAPGWHPSNSCVVAFEASPHWTARLHTVADMIRPQLQDIHIYTATAISADHRRAHVDLLVDTKSQGQVGTSIVSASQTTHSASLHIRTKNLADWLGSHVLGHNAIPCVMRKDIEGEEYETLKDLIISGIAHRLTTRGISLHIGIEWHRFAKDKVLGERQLRLMSKLDNAFLWAAPLTKGMLSKQMEKMITYWLATANVSTSDRHNRIKLTGAYPRDYLLNDDLQDRNGKTTAISQAEFESAISHGRRKL